jgi:hypothetical protein
VPVDAHAGRRDGQLALLKRDQLVVPVVDLAHEPAAPAHLNLRGLAGLLGHDAKAAEVGRPVVLHARVVGGEADLEGEGLAHANRVAARARRERRALAKGRGGEEQGAGCS